MAAYTLTQIAAVLGEPQHRLLHLCDKKVIVPDIDDAHGRGSSRLFSERNVFQFAVALELRRLPLPVAVVEQWIRGLDRLLESSRPTIHAPDDLVRTSSAKISLAMVDGGQLLLTIGDPIRPDAAYKDSGQTATPTGSPAAGSSPKLSRGEARRVIGNGRSLIVIELSRIAADLALKVGDRLTR